MTSSPGLEDDTYGLGERIRITVTFDQAVLVVGDPEFGLDVGGPRLAGYESGSGTDRLVFVYTVHAGDRDDNGIWIGNHNHADNRTFRLDGNDSIRNATGDADAELAHDVPGRQSGHKVDGSRQGGRHSHPEFNHTHAHFNSDQGYYTQEYADHTHASHVHGDRDNGHSSGMRPGQHHHHEQDPPHPLVFLGPDILSHDDESHTHVCRDIEPACDWGDNFNHRGGSLGLPIRVTHAHPNSEPGHDFDWKTYFDELEEPAPEPESTPMPTGLMATAGDAQVMLTWNAPAPDSGVTHHEYRYKTSGDYPANWTRITNSAPGGDQCVRVHGEQARQRDGLHLRAARGRRGRRQRRGDLGHGDADDAAADHRGSGDLDADAGRGHLRRGRRHQDHGDVRPAGAGRGRPGVRARRRRTSPGRVQNGQRHRPAGVCLHGAVKRARPTRCRRTTATATASGSGTTSTPAIRRSGWTATTASGTPWATRTPSWPTPCWARSPATRWTARGRAEHTPIPSSPTLTRISIPTRGTTPRSMPTIPIRIMCTTTRITTIRPRCGPASTTTTSRIRGVRPSSSVPTSCAMTLCCIRMSAGTSSPNAFGATTSTNWGALWVCPKGTPMPMRNPSRATATTGRRISLTGSRSRR